MVAGVRITSLYFIMHDTEILEWIEKLKRFDGCILVEGKKDIDALHTLGVRKVMSLNGRPLYAIVEEIAAKTAHCAILTDLDREGKKLFGRLNSELQKHGVQVDTSFRDYLFIYTKLRHIQGMVSYLKTQGLIE